MLFRMHSAFPLFSFYNLFCLPHFGTLPLLSNRLQLLSDALQLIIMLLSHLDQQSSMFFLQLFELLVEFLVPWV